MAKPFQLSEYENALIHYVAKCGDNQPKTIADIGKAYAIARTKFSFFNLNGR
jgi:hypothetical protein